jgi:hypothetical protein
VAKFDHSQIVESSFVTFCSSPYSLQNLPPKFIKKARVRATTFRAANVSAALKQPPLQINDLRQISAETAKKY